MYVIITDKDGNPIDSTHKLEVNASFTGGAVTIADGGDSTQGAKADAAIQDASSSASEIALLKGLQAILGLVTASPTANTVSDRLKVINTTLSASKARTMAHTVGAAGIASSTALALNANRKYALIVNDSANVVYIKLGATAALNTGIRLNANGGSYEINETNLYTGVIDCISSVAAQTLLVTEGV